jgi:Na+/proline symporter
MIETDWMQTAPWLVFLGYVALVWWVTPRRVTAAQFFQGHSTTGLPPGVLLLGVSGAISWVMAKSVDNAMNLAADFGLWGGIGYAAYWLSFITAGIAIYFMRTRGGHRSLPGFLVDRYGGFAAKCFLLVIAIRLFNEVWSNTKVTSQFFGAEGSPEYWMAAAGVMAFTLFYSWRGGLRSSLITDAMQMLLLGLLLAVVLITLGPELAQSGIPRVANGGVTEAMQSAGLTFFALAMVQTLSYPFHDPVLTDRAFISPPKSMLRGFVLAGILGGGVILLYSIAGLYALGAGTGVKPSVSVAVPQAIGLWMLLVFNAVMLTSAGSTLDSTFASSAKFAARDWQDKRGEPNDVQVRTGRWIMLTIALLGNLPLFSLYIKGIGPAVIAATTISGTAVMGLAPIFLLAWLRGAGKISFHLAFWPGIILGVMLVLESFLDLTLFPSWIQIGSGKFAKTLGVNVFGLIACTAGYVAGALFMQVTRASKQLGKNDAML